VTLYRDGVLSSNLSGLPESTEEGRALLQARVAGFGLAAGIGTGAFYLFRVLALLAQGRAEALLQTDMVAHLAGALLVLTTWIICRRGRLSARRVRAVESVGLVAGCAAFVVMGMGISLVERPSLIVILALTYVMVARAFYVPSTPGRTTWLGVAVGIPLLATTYHAYASVDLQQIRAVMQDSEGFTVSQLALVQTVWALAFWSMSVGVCRLAAKVIFGLRTEVSAHQRLGRYTLERKLGQGGMGVVYSASHAMLKRPTAIKLLPPSKLGEAAVARFEREVQMTAALSHPNTVRVFDYGHTPDGVFYYAMELLDGGTLEDVVEVDGPQPPARVAHILAQAAGALAEAHDKGLIHRDIKPSNIMLVDQGGVPDSAKVLDFGLVKEQHADTETAKTGIGVLTGTPQYLCPEAIRTPEAVDERSDLYALGAVGYFLLTGEPVFAAPTVVEVCSDHLHTDPVLPSERLGAELPRALEQLLIDCLAKAPGDRPASARAIQEALQSMADLGRWSREDAADWWAQHGDAVSERRAERGGSTAGGTVAIALER
jgi:hypothetical protein